jgi:hypothetical protein
MPERGGRPDEVGLDLYYSFDLGPIHFVSINTEYYYFLEVDRFVSLKILIHLISV